MKPDVLDPTFGHLLVDPGPCTANQPFWPNPVKPPDVDGPCGDFDVGSVHFPAVTKRQIAGDPHRAAIGQSKADILKPENIALQRRCYLEPAERKRCLCIGKGQIALADPDGNRQCLDDTARTKPEIDAAVGHPDEPLILAGTYVKENVAEYRTQIQRDNLELRASTVDATGYFNGEIRQITPGKAFLQPLSRLVCKAGGPVGIDLLDGPAVAAKAERKLRRRTMERIHVARKRQGAPVSQCKLTLRKHKAACFALVFHDHRSRVIFQHRKACRAEIKPASQRHHIDIRRDYFAGRQHDVRVSGGASDIGQGLGQLRQKRRQRCQPEVIHLDVQPHIH